MLLVQGEAALSLYQIKVIIKQAASDLQDISPTFQDTYASAFANFLPELTAANNTILRKAFAQAMSENVFNTRNSRLGAAGDQSGPLLALAHAAGLDQAVADGFTLVRLT